MSKVPRLKQSEIEERRRIVRACVASKRELNGWNDSQTAAKCRFSTDTLHRRLETPEKFTLAELWGMGITVFLYDGQSRLPDGQGIIKLEGGTPQ